MSIDIKSSNTLRAYSSEELQEYARKGLLCCGQHDLSEFLEKLLEGMYSQEELDKALDTCEEDVRSERSDWCSECEAELN